MQKKKNINVIEQKVKKSRAKYERPPEALEIFIGWDNAISPNIELPGWESVWDKYKLGRGDEENPFLKTCQLTFEECFQYFSEADKTILKNHFFSEFIHPSSPEKSMEELEAPILFYAFTTWYPAYQQRRKDLRDIAKFFFHIRNNDYLSATDEELKTTGGEVIRLPIFNIYLSRKGTIGTAITPAYKAYVGVDLDRIRACKICNRIFWAKNRNSETCPGTCRNALKQRNHREKNKEAINAKRRENYNRNKKLKEIRSKEDGTL